MFEFLKDLKSIWIDICTSVIAVPFVFLAVFLFGANFISNPNLNSVMENTIVVASITTGFITVILPQALSKKGKTPYTQGLLSRERVAKRITTYIRWYYFINILFLAISILVLLRSSFCGTFIYKAIFPLWCSVGASFIITTLHAVHLFLNMWLEPDLPANYDPHGIVKGNK